MDGFKDFLSDNLPVIPKEVIPAVSFGLILLSIVLVLIFFVMCVAYINSQPKQKVITPLKRDDLKNKKEKGDSVNEKTSKIGVCENLPTISGRLGEILSRLGFLNVGPITKMFFNVLESIRNSTYDLRWRYKLPCFMIIGPKGSGKTTLLNNLNFEHLVSEKSENDSFCIR